MSKKRKLDKYFNLLPSDCIENVVGYLNYNTIVDLMSCSKELFLICNKTPKNYNLEAKETYIKVQYRLNFMKCESLLKEHSSIGINSLIEGIELEQSLKENYKKWGLTIYKFVNNTHRTEIKFTLFNKNDFIFEIMNIGINCTWFRVYHRGKCYGIFLSLKIYTANLNFNEIRDFVESQIDDKNIHIDNILSTNMDIRTKIINMNKKKTLENMEPILKLMNVNIDFTYKELYKLLRELSFHISEKSIMF